MVAPETEEYYALQDQIVAKQAQVNGATGAARLTFLSQLETLKALAESMLIRDEGECIVRLDYVATNPQGVDIPFLVNGLQNNMVFYVSDMAGLVVEDKGNDYLTMREKAKYYVLGKLKEIGFLGLTDSDYTLA